MARILIVGGQGRIRRSLVSILTREGFGVCEETGWDGVLKVCEKAAYDLVMVDLDAKPPEGDKILKRIKRVNGSIEMVAIVSQNRYDAHQMNNDGVYDCLRKPFRQKEVVHLVKKALEKKQLADKVRNMEQIIDI
ncbi:MAG: hypothetical protein DCC43_08860 [Candidatus Brocadia sp.]|jgi:DNA-binding NtrC family response regulator|uniref:Two-component response regulator n=1 Tax=Candidatus Brocadia fulgida TaxID=380242 RepID=A0A0M2UV42_9BACT|nr:MAG: two-component response regulator [Candidatus Brocadia fulgida]MCC6324512.1 response regulator [Candidatus Brocadia sp.]MCE7911122.1 response regulator [Candidatus Brocadia sp. AMX3]OQZ00019.1 MAG: hypothetical protein B6D35_07855 [Candidatus Brocadia sp. UTAMX2]MBV6519240.1 hypothetical protein [Candidatus Brocadia fulgida]